VFRFAWDPSDKGMTTARCHVLLREAGAMGRVKTNAALRLVSVKAQVSITIVSLSPWLHYMDVS
jgi:hypothetical protein